MIIGQIKPGEKKVRMQIDIICTQCKTKVPGGIQTAEKHYNTDSFHKELEELKRTYLCGRCRDKKRVSNNST